MATMMTNPSTMPAVKVLPSQIVLMMDALKGRKSARLGLGATVSIAETDPSPGSELAKITICARASYLRQRQCLFKQFFFWSAEGRGKVALICIVIFGSIMQYSARKHVGNRNGSIDEFVTDTELFGQASGQRARSWLSFEGKRLALVLVL